MESIVVSQTSAHSQCYSPYKIKSKCIRYPESYYIILQKRRFSELSDMMFCQRHACRSAPTEVAHFDFVLPEAFSGSSRDGIFFSGIVEMCVVRGKNILLTHVDMCPVGKKKLLDLH